MDAYSVMPSDALYPMFRNLDDLVLHANVLPHNELVAVMRQAQIRADNHSVPSGAPTVVTSLIIARHVSIACSDKLSRHLSHWRLTLSAHSLLRRRAPCRDVYTVSAS